MSLSEAKNGDSQSFLLTGKNQTLQAIVDKVKDRVTKPIKYAEEVDPQKKVPEFSIEVQDGTWTDLLSRIAKTFACELKETDEAFLIQNEKLVEEKPVGGSSTSVDHSISEGGN